MHQYKFAREITRREAINNYGRLGFNTHREVIYINAVDLDQAMDYVEPFNYKKHIRFKLAKIYKEPKVIDAATMQIIDEGVVGKIESEFWVD